MYAKLKHYPTKKHSVALPTPSKQSGNIVSSKLLL